MHAAEQITDPLRGHRHRPTAAPAPALADTPQSPAPVMCRAVRGCRLSCARGSARSRHVTRRARRTGTDREPSHRLRGPHRAGMAMLGAGASVSNDAAVGVGWRGWRGATGFGGERFWVGVQAPSSRSTSPYLGPPSPLSRFSFRRRHCRGRCRARRPAVVTRDQLCGTRVVRWPGLSCVGYGHARAHELKEKLANHVAVAALEATGAASARRHGG